MRACAACGRTHGERRRERRHEVWRAWWNLPEPRWRGAAAVKLLMLEKGQELRRVMRGGTRASDGCGAGGAATSVARTARHASPQRSA